MRGLIRHLEGPLLVYEARALRPRQLLLLKSVLLLGHRLLPSERLWRLFSFDLPEEVVADETANVGALPAFRLNHLVPVFQQRAFLIKYVVGQPLLELQLLLLASLAGCLAHLYLFVIVGGERSSRGRR